MKVDTLVLGVKEILSQLREDNEIYLCAAFSHCLKYDMGDCELLVVKLALKEWRLWLKGVETLMIL